MLLAPKHLTWPLVRVFENARGVRKKLILLLRRQFIELGRGPYRLS
jgi:hypothetical protein